FPSARRAELLRPVNARLEARVHGIRHAHVTEGRIHEVGAVLGAAEPPGHRVLGPHDAAREVLSGFPPAVTAARDALFGRAAVAPGVIHVAVGGHVAGILRGGPLEDGIRRERRRRLEVRRSAVTRARAGLVGQLEHPAADRGPIADGRRRKGLRKRQPHIGAALEGADLAEGGIGALLAVLPRDDAPHVPARGHARDLHRERARGVVARELLRGAQLSSLRQLPRHLIEPGALPERHQAAGMPATAVPAHAVDIVDHVGGGGERRKQRHEQRGEQQQDLASDPRVGHCSLHDGAAGSRAIYNHGLAVATRKRVSPAERRRRVLRAHARGDRGGAPLRAARDVSGALGRGRHALHRRPPAGRGPRRGPWRELMVEIQGAVIADWQRAFARTWRRCGPELALVEPRACEAHADGAAGRLSLSEARQRSVLANGVLRRIDSATARAWIMSAYFVPSRRFRKALRRAARRGVDVRLLLPGARTDHPWVRQAARRFYGKLLRNGVKIFEYQPRMLHAKMILCDDWVSIGSSNLDRWSFRWNLEANQEIADADFANA